MGDSEQSLIEEMERRARESMVTHEILQFPLGVEVAGFYASTERARRSKRAADTDKEPGNIHTVRVDGEKRRYWGFGILDLFLVEKNIEAGDFIIVTRQEKSEKGFWTCDFGFAKANGEGGVSNGNGKKTSDKKIKAQ